MQMLTPKGEFAFVAVHKPAKPMEGDDDKEPQYQLTILWDEDNPKLKAMEKKVLEVAESKWGKKAKAMLEKGQLHNPLRAYDEDTDPEWMEGTVRMKAVSNERPDVVDEDLEDIIDSKEVYSGAIGRMDVWLYPFEKKGNKGVSAILNNVQKLEAGERKGGRRTGAEAFGDDDEDDEAPKSRRSRRRSDEDEDETPKRSRRSSRRGNSDDDDDDQPSGRRSRRKGRR